MNMEGKERGELGGKGELREGTRKKGRRKTVKVTGGDGRPGGRWTRA